MTTACLPTYYIAANHQSYRIKFNESPTTDLKALILGKNQHKCGLFAVRHNQQNVL